MVKRIFYFSLILVCGIAITFVACSDENNVKNEQNQISNLELSNARQKSFESTIAKIKKKYPQEDVTQTSSEVATLNSMITCGAESDPQVNCAGAFTQTFTLQFQPMVKFIIRLYRLLLVLQT